MDGLSGFLDTPLSTEETTGGEVTDSRGEPGCVCTEASCTIQLKDVVVWEAKIVLSAMILGRLCLGKENSGSHACSQEC